MNHYQRLRNDLLTQRYLLEGETEKGLWKRVTDFVTQGGKFGGSEKAAINQLLSDGFIIYNSPLLMNAGTSKPLASACYVLPVEDDMESIMELQRLSAKVFKMGAGVGVDYSKLRASGIPVASGGSASGPCSFMELIDKLAEVVKSGGRRRAAIMSTLDVTHPDIETFINYKKNEDKLQNTNISVRITDNFMQNAEARNTKEWYLWQKIIQNAWATGDPGLIFIDTINQNTPSISDMKYEAVNACSEFALYPYESCLIGTINLAKIKVTNDMDVLEHDVRGLTRILVRTLDNVIDYAWYPDDRIKEAALNYRRVGVGVTGLGDILIRYNISYGSEAAERLIHRIFSSIREEAIKTTVELGNVYGNFPVFPDLEHSADDIWYPSKRNLATMVIAPTGSTSYLVGAECSGIEPMYSIVQKRTAYLNEGTEEYFIVSKLFREEFEKYYGTELTDEQIQLIWNNKGSIQGLDWISEDLQKVFVVAHDIKPVDHLQTAIIIQKYVDNSISKTINLPESATIEDVDYIFKTAWESNLKGITIYRDNSKSTQIYKTSDKKADYIIEHEVEKIAGQGEFTDWIITQLHGEQKEIQLPYILDGKRIKIATPRGNLYTMVNFFKGKPMEVFVTVGKSGGNDTAYTEALGRLISLALRSGVDVSKVVQTLKGIRGKEFWEFNNEVVYSVPDAIAIGLRELAMLEPTEIEEDTITEEIEPTHTGKMCPECGADMNLDNGCWVCSNCMWSYCDS